MTDPNAGFQGLQGELSAATQQNKAINDQLSAGQFRIDPAVAEDAAKHCEQFAEQITDLVRHARQLAQVHGLGNYQVSTGIAHHFQQKATQPGSGAADLLQQLHDEMYKQAAAFRSAAKDYRARDEDIAQTVGKAGQ